MRPFLLRVSGFLLALVLISSPHNARAQTGDPCPGQGHIATAADAPIPVGAKVCPNDGGQPILKGGCDFNPYPYLETVKTSAGVIVTPRAVEGSGLRDGIDPALACRLATLIKALSEKGCYVKLSSAYRSPELQASMCGTGRDGCAAAGTSCHQYGLSVDITSNCTPQLRTFLGTRSATAIGAQQFKLHFPYYGDHIQCSEHTQAACSPSTPPCPGGAKITPAPYMPNISAFGTTLGQPTNLTSSLTDPMNPAYLYEQQVFSPYATPAVLPPPLPMPAMPIAPITPIAPASSGGGIGNTNTYSGSGQGYNTSPPAISPTPIYATSTSHIPAAALIIAQSSKVPVAGSTLVAWTSVGMSAQSCTITQNGVAFGTGSQGSKLLGLPATAQAGTIALLFECTDLSGIHHKRAVNIFVE